MNLSCQRHALRPRVKPCSATSLGANPPPAVRATGYEVIQRDAEPPLPPDCYKTGANLTLTASDLIDARHWWRPSRQYSKTLLANTPLQWAAGFHTVTGSSSKIATRRPSDALTLIHLHKVDFDLALTRLQRTRARKWSRLDIERRRGWQNRIDNAAELRGFWELDVDTEQPAEAGRLLPIAGGIKQALR
jgi:hypothetical protein